MIFCSNSEGLREQAPKVFASRLCEPREQHPQRELGIGTIRLDSARFVGVFMRVLPPRYGATRRREELARQVGKTVLKIEVCLDDIVKKPSKTPTTMLVFNDLR